MSADQLVSHDEYEMAQVTGLTTNVVRKMVCDLEGAGYRIKKVGKKKRGRKPTTSITTGMYVDYCTGMSIAQVAAKWGRHEQAIYHRFRAMNLPLRTSARKASRQPARTFAASGVPFSQANAVRQQVGADRQCQKVRQVLPTVKDPRIRLILQLRVQHPDKSLAEIGQMVIPPVSKDVVSGIVRRAIGLASA